MATVDSISRWLPTLAARATASSPSSWKARFEPVGATTIGLRVGLAEQLHPRVELADIDQAARPELEFLEALAVGAQRHLVVDAGRHVAEMRRRHVLVRDQLEVEHVERLARAADQLVERARSPDHRIGQALQLLRERLGAAEQAGSRRGTDSSRRRLASVFRPIG